MIERLYRVACDYCGRGIRLYANKKPTMEMLEAAGVICTATKHFCDKNCWDEWNRKIPKPQYPNLHPDGRINRDY